MAISSSPVECFNGFPSFCLYRPWLFFSNWEGSVGFSLFLESPLFSMRFFKSNFLNRKIERDPRNWCRGGGKTNPLWESSSVQVVIYHSGCVPLNDIQTLLATHFIFGENESIWLLCSCQRWLASDIGWPTTPSYFLFLFFLCVVKRSGISLPKRTGRNVVRERDFSVSSSNFFGHGPSHDRHKPRQQLFLLHWIIYFNIDRSKIAPPFFLLETFLIQQNKIVFLARNKKRPPVSWVQKCWTYLAHALDAGIVFD